MSVKTAAARIDRLRHALERHRWLGPNPAGDAGKFAKLIHRFYEQWIAEEAANGVEPRWSAGSRAFRQVVAEIIAEEMGENQ